MKLKKLFISSAAVFSALALMLPTAQTAYAIGETRMMFAPSESADISADTFLSSYKYTELGNGDIEITEYNGFASELTVPSSIDGHKVVAVRGLNLPYGVLSVTIPGSVKKVYGISGSTLIKVTLNEGVEEIGEYAFGYYTGGLSPRAVNQALIEVNLPSDLKKIGESAFEGCWNLERVNIPENCEIGEKAFYRCGSLPCPDEAIVSAAGAHAFEYTKDFDSYGGRSHEENGCTIVGTRLISSYSKEAVLEIPEGVEYIDFDFYDSHNDNTAGHHFKEVVLPTTIKKVSGFDNCSELEKVTFKGTPEVISSFNNCPKLSEIKFPEGTKEIDGFSECPLLTHVDIPSSVERLSGFHENENLESVTFHDGSLKVIGEYAFSECGKLDNVALPSPLEELDSWAFSNCSSLEHLTFPDTLYRVNTDLENDPWYYKQPLGEQLYIGSCFIGFPHDYSGNYPESYTLKSGTKGINVTYGIRGLKALPDSLKFVGNITGYSGKDLIIPEGVEYLTDNFSFYGDQVYDTVVIPASVKTVSLDSFNFSCKKLIFRGCPELTGSGDPKSVPGIKSVETPEGFDAFSAVTLPDDGTYFFSNESGNSLWLSDVKTKNITADMLDGVKSLSIYGGDAETIVLPSSVREVELSSLSSLKTVEFTSSVQKVSVSECPKLTALDLPRGVRELRIRDCNFLKTLNAPDTIIRASYYGEKASWYRSLPDGPLYIGKCLVGYKGEMPDNCKLTVPEGVISVCDFPSNEKLTELVLPSTCLYVDGFEYSKALKKLDLGGVVYVDDYAFKYAPITELKIGDDCRYIGGNAFLCTTLDTIVLPDSMEYVAFGNFDVKKAYVSNNMHTAANYCDLDGVVYTINSNDSGNSTGLFNTNDDDAPVIIGYSGTAFEQYAKNMSGWGYTFMDAEKGDGSETGGYTFDETTGTLEITTDEGMTEWSNMYRSRSSSGYSKGTVIKPTFPEKLEKVKKVVIGEKVTTIAPFAFSLCTNLESVTIPSNVTLVSEGAFSGCTSLKNVAIERNYSEEDQSGRLSFSPDTGSAAEYRYLTSPFDGCDSLESITIPEGADVPCVWNCPAFKEINIKYDCGAPESDGGYTKLDERQFMNVGDGFAINVPKDYEDNWKSRFPYYEDIINPGSNKVYLLSVNGKRFTSNALSIPCGDGTAQFDPNTNTLTLTNATITRSSVDFFYNYSKTENGVWPSPDAGIKSALGQLNIVLVGENKFLCPTEESGDFESEYPGYIIQGIGTTGGLTVTGSGSLTFESMDFTGIDCGGKLKIDGAQLKFIYRSENFEGGSSAYGFLDGSDIEISGCDLFGAYIYGSNDVTLTNTKLDTNGQSIIFGRTFTAKNCDITVRNEYAANGGAFLIDTEEDVKDNPKFGMTFEDTVVHVSVPGMVTNLYTDQIKLVGRYGVVSGDWDGRNIEIGLVTYSTDEQTGIQTINVGDYSFSAREVTLENDYDGLYNGMYNYASGYLKLFSGNRPEYRILKAYKLTLKNEKGEEIGGENFTFRIPVPESLAPENELKVFRYGAEGDPESDENTDNSLSETYFVIRDGYINITVNNYDKCIFAVVAPESYYIPKPPISGTVTGSNTGSVIKVSLFDIKENWEISNTYTTSDPFEFKFENLPNGTFLLRAEEDEHTTYERLVTVTEGSPIVLNITLRPLGEESTCEVISSNDQVKAGEVYGDVDGDGAITANDALAILRSSVGMADMTPEQITLSDVDSDGQITANDALAVLRASVGMEEDNLIGKKPAP